MRAFGLLVISSLLIFQQILSPFLAQAQTGNPEPVGSPNPECFNRDYAQYNSASCQEGRDSESGRQFEKDECEKEKPSGAVWVVFARQCVTFVEFGSIAISYVLTFASIIAGVMFVAASFKYLSSKGDPSALADARDMMINAAVGMVLVATAFAIVQLLNSSFGFAGGAVNLLPFFDYP